MMLEKMKEGRKDMKGVKMKLVKKEGEKRGGEVR